MPLLSILGYTFLSSFLSLIGGVSLLVFKGAVKKVYLGLVSFAAGALLGAVFFDLLPEANEAGNGSIFIFVTVGIILFFFVEKFLLWYHAHTGHEEHAEHKTVVPLIVIGDAVHNFIDGVVVAGSFLASHALGVVTAFAVFLHEIPQEIGDFSVLLYAKIPTKKVLLYNVISSLAAFLGAIVMFFAASRIEGLLTPIVAVTAGGFLYIALAELTPEIMHREKPGISSWIHGFVLVLGVATIYLITKFVA